MNKSLHIFWNPSFFYSLLTKQYIKLLSNLYHSLKSLSINRSLSWNWFISTNQIIFKKFLISIRKWISRYWNPCFSKHNNSKYCLWKIKLVKSPLCLICIINWNIILSSIVIEIRSVKISMHYSKFIWIIQIFDILWRKLNTLQNSMMDLIPVLNSFSHLLMFFWKFLWNYVKLSKISPPSFY